ncbi:MAG: ribonuclease P protein subunit [Nanoarchaeota archaeon]|nr:ribonuclease P protein subunit [Nanoarchaeota archaeon]
MIDKIKNIPKSELIGLMIETPSIQGKIINETKHTLEVIDGKGQRKKVLKNQEIILIKNNQKIKIHGKILEIKPEERLKKIKW